MLRIALPCSNTGALARLPDAARFAFFDVNPQTMEVLEEGLVSTQRQQSDKLPAWIAERGAHVVLVQGIRRRMLQGFCEHKLQVVLGVPPGELRKMVEKYVAARPSPLPNEARTDPGVRKVRDNGFPQIRKAER